MRVSTKCALPVAAVLFGLLLRSEAAQLRPDDEQASLGLAKVLASNLVLPPGLDHFASFGHRCDPGAAGSNHREVGIA
jgi:hypothetical protein